MFWKKKDVEEMPIGAIAKLKRARRLRAMGQLDLNSGNRQAGPNEHIYSTLIIAGLATVLAWFLTDGPIRAGAMPKTGFMLLDDLVFAPTPLAVTGSPTLDMILAILLRAGVFMVAAGFLPAAAWLWSEVIDRPLMSAYRTVWGVTLGLAVLVLTIKPVFAMIIDNFIVLFG